jgi:outer membrane protein insertion porin family
MGGDFDLRGFDFRSVGPIAFINRSTTTVDPTTGVSTTVPFDDIVHVGGDTQGLFNFEYRIPITGPFTLAPFLDVGNTWVLNRNALLRNVTDSLGQVSAQSVNLLPGTNSGLRISTGVELQITLPVINLPMRLIFAVNPSRIDRTYIGPTVGTPINVQQPFQGFRFSIGKTF